MFQLPALTGRSERVKNESLLKNNKAGSRGWDVRRRYDM